MQVKLTLYIYSHSYLLHFSYSSYSSTHVCSLTIYTAWSLITILHTSNIMRCDIVMLGRGGRGSRAPPGHARDAPARAPLAREPLGPCTWLCAARGALSAASTSAAPAGAPGTTMHSVLRRYLVWGNYTHTTIHTLDKCEIPRRVPDRTTVTLRRRFRWNRCQDTNTDR